MSSSLTCVFCQIVEGTSPASIVYSDDRIMAFMTLRPINPGEFLIIPKEHIDHFCDIPDELSCQIMLQAQRLSRTMRKKLQPERVGLVVHGYGVAHAHLVVVPLHEEADIVSAKHAYVENGQVKFSEELVAEMSRDELDGMAQLLRDG